MKASETGGSGGKDRRKSPPFLPFFPDSPAERRREQRPLQETGIAAKATVCSGFPLQPRLMDQKECET